LDIAVPSPRFAAPSMWCAASDCQLQRHYRFPTVVTRFYGQLSRFSGSRTAGSETIVIGVSLRLSAVCGFCFRVLPAGLQLLTDVFHRESATISMIVSDSATVGQHESPV